LNLKRFEIGLKMGLKKKRKKRKKTKPPNPLSPSPFQPSRPTLFFFSQPAAEQAVGLPSPSHARLRPIAPRRPPS
jgi:hypothetical protein